MSQCHLQERLLRDILSQSLSAARGEAKSVKPFQADGSAREEQQIVTKVIGRCLLANPPTRGGCHPPMAALSELVLARDLDVVPLRYRCRSPDHGCPGRR